MPSGVSLAVRSGFSVDEATLKQVDASNAAVELAKGIREGCQNGRKCNKCATGPFALNNELPNHSQSRHKMADYKVRSKVTGAIEISLAGYADPFVFIRNRDLAKQLNLLA